MAVNLTLTDDMAQIVKMALIVESEGPRSDDRTEFEIEQIEAIIENIDHHRKWWVFYESYPRWKRYPAAPFPMDFRTACRSAKRFRKEGWNQIHITTNKDWGQ